MVNISATVTFKKDKHQEELEVLRSFIMNYNIIAGVTDTQSIDSEEVDCGETVEIRIKMDLDPKLLQTIEEIAKN